MPKSERRIIDFIQAHIHIFFVAAVLLLGCGMRIVGYHFLSDDARLYLLKWYDQIAVKGISEQVGNYNIPYQILIYILTKLPLKPLHAYKTVSCIFDLGMALLCGWIIWMLSDKSREWRGVMAFALVFCSPIVVLNSSVWAQCDSIYTFFGIAAFLMLWKEKYRLSFVFLGLAFAFKLQSAFFLPFFLLYYVYKKRFSICNFLIVPVMMILMSLPGLIAGRNIGEIFFIYAGQTNTYNRVFVNFPNVYTLLTNMKGGGDYPMFRFYAILMTILILGFGVYFCVSRNARLDQAKVFWGVVIWTLYSCSFFLPNMHERYAYVMEALAIAYCFITPAGIPVAVTANLLSTMTYAYYLFDHKYVVSISMASLISLLVYIGFTRWLFCQAANEPPHSGQISENDTDPVSKAGERV